MSWSGYCTCTEDAYDEGYEEGQADAHKEAEVTNESNQRVLDWVREQRLLRAVGSSSALYESETILDALEEEFK